MATDLRITRLLVSSLLESSERARNLAMHLNGLVGATLPCDASEQNRVVDDLRATRATLDYTRDELARLEEHIERRLPRPGADG